MKKNFYIHTYTLATLSLFSCTLLANTLDSIETGETEQPNNPTLTIQDNSGPCPSVTEPLGKCSIKSPEDLQFTDRMYLENGTWVLNQYTNELEIITSCLNSPTTRQDDESVEVRSLIDSKIKVLSIVHGRLGEHIEDRLKMPLNESKEHLEKFKTTSQCLSNKKLAISEELLRLYRLRDPNVNNDDIKFDQDEKILSCKVGIKLENLEKSKQNLSAYLESCRSAFNHAIQINDKDLLKKLRKAAQSSIVTIKQQTSLWFTQFSTDPTVFEDLSGVENDKSGAVGIQSLVESSQQSVATLEKISGMDSRLPLMPNWQNEPFTYQFYLGFDLNDSSKFETSENANIGLQLYFRPDRQLDEIRNAFPSCRVSDTACGKFKSFIPHTFLSLSTGSSAEQSSADNSNATAWEAGVFWPWYIGRRGRDQAHMTEFMIGPVWLRGSSNLDSTEGYLDRKYWGLRLAFNEETYFDLLRGDSDGFASKRYNLRGQFPVDELGSGRLFFGVDINFSSYGRDSDNQNDSTKLYLIWQTGFDDLWNVGSSN